jgi:hypothetical protein
MWKEDIYCLVEPLSDAYLKILTGSGGYTGANPGQIQDRFSRVGGGVDKTWTRGGKKKSPGCYTGGDIGRGHAIEA